MYRRVSLNEAEGASQITPEDVVGLQKALALEKERNEIISSLFEDWVYEYNIADRVVTTINGSSEQYHLLGNKETMQTYLRLDDLHPDDRTKFIKCCRGIDPEQGNSYVEVRIKVGGVYRWISLTTRLLCDAAGVPLSVIGKLSDIDEKKKEELRLREKATKDSLTGLLNRTAFREEAGRELAQAKETGSRNLAMLILDIDNFKSINDNYGHLYGDTVIVSMAEAMREIASGDDILGRFGGDEFTILFKNYESTEALKNKIEQLCGLFTKACVLEREDKKITCSAGVAVYGADGTELKELAGNADLALYYVKDKGKNNYAFCTEQMKLCYAENVRRERTEEVIPERKDVSEEIVEFALGLLEESKDLKSSINMLLSKIGKRFGLSCVTVREEDDIYGFSLSYYWVDEKKMPKATESIPLSQAERKLIAKNFRNNNMVEFSDILEVSPENPLYRVYIAKGIRALLQCPFFAEGKVFGYICYADCTRNRIWKEEERQSLNVISKIVGNYLARERAYQKIEQKVELMKSYDEITGLLKFDKFKEVAQNILETSNDRVRYAVVSSDISHFKYFNEVYGFRNGDEVLKDFATLIVKHNPRAVAACRDYADDFLVMVTVNSQEALLRNIEHYNRTFILNQSEKFTDSNLEVCSGAYIIDNPEAGILQAIDNANIARKLVKEQGTSGILMFEPSMKVNRLKEIALLHMIEEAIENEEFRVYFQPKVSLETGELVGAEALARWQKPDGTVAEPGEFVPALEKSGKIVTLDFLMYEAVLRQLKKWKKRGLKTVPVSVNLSRHHMKNQSIAGDLLWLLQQYHLDAEQIEIEVTESAFVEDQRALIRTMREIKNHGFGISIDDFGKGYSSLSMLTELPADIVKIDKDFLRNSEAVSARGMLHNVIHMIQDNQMKVVCEGVETKEQAEFLAVAGCDIGQGYYYSKPVPADEFEMKYLKK